MSAETIERCDVCQRVVSDVLRDESETSLRHHGYGYIKAKRYTWRFGPWPRFWHREDLGWDTICDLCLDMIGDAVRAADEADG